MTQPGSTQPDTAMFKLIAQKLGSDPIAFIAERRNRTPAMSYARIAEELRAATGEYLTHELPRRWHRHAQGLPARVRPKAA